MTNLLLLLLTATLAVAADPFVGTWKPDLDKWKLSPGAPEARKKQVITMEAAGKDAYNNSATVDGKKEGPELWPIDGKEHENQGPGGVKITMKSERIGERHLRMTVKGPKGTTVSDFTVSQDGKTMTTKRKGTGSTSGRTIDETLVYNKQ